VVILESAAAALLAVGSVLILRACWQADQPRVTRARMARSFRREMLDKRAA